MFQSIPGLEPFLLTVALIIGPWVVAEVRRLRQQARQAQNSNVAQPTPSRRRWLVMALVAAHSTYIFYKLFLHPPLNIFTALRAPLTTPSATLRNMLLTRAEPPSDALPAPLEELLVRLSSFDVRTLYIRFVPLPSRRPRLRNVRAPGSGTTQYKAVSIARPRTNTTSSRCPHRCSSTCARRWSLAR